MKVLFLTLAKIDDIEIQGIYPDLLRIFRDKGHEVTIVTPIERKFNKPTMLFSKNGVKILQVWTTNIQKTNIFEKAFTTILLEFYYLLAIRKFLSYTIFDLILYSTPPITLTNLIKKLKKKSHAKTYLLLKDIFPQNAADLNLISQKNLLFKYFRWKEKVLYRISDNIGCMSEANLNYVLDHNPEVVRDKIEINPNSIEIRKDQITKNPEIYKKYNIPSDKIIFIFGGNLGIPQSINLLIKHITFCRSITNAFFLIVGDGTEYEEFNNWIKIEKVSNVLLIKELPKLDYDEIIALSHVGLIFLNPNFTIPNFPSRILSYMQNKLPVICATDNFTDIGTIASINKFGFKCLTTDFETFFNHVVKLLNEDLRCQMGQNAFQYLQKEYTVEKSYQKIINKFK